jgi:thymidylate synthase (FAD)
MVRYVEESVEILDKIDGMEILKKIERAGRTCYKSEDLITDDSCIKFAEMILGRNHLSVIEHVSVTVKFITCRGMTHELVRHRIASYSQESTRYCNYGKEKFGKEITVIDQIKMFQEILHVKSIDLQFNEMCAAWKRAIEQSEREYFTMIENGAHPELARGVLPNDLKTEIVTTMNLREWRYVLGLRTSPAAHPNIRELMKKLHEQFKQKIPILFDKL